MEEYFQAIQFLQHTRHEQLCALGNWPVAPVAVVQSSDGELGLAELTDAAPGPSKEQAGAGSSQSSPEGISDTLGSSAPCSTSGALLLQPRRRGPAGALLCKLRNGTMGAPRWQPVPPRQLPLCQATLPRRPRVLRCAAAMSRAAVAHRLLA
eukprot:363221-Chlamydomonas_euryale.AAC.14